MRYSNHKLSPLLLVILTLIALCSTSCGENDYGLIDGDAELADTVEGDAIEDDLEVSDGDIDSLEADHETEESDSESAIDGDNDNEILEDEIEQEFEDELEEEYEEEIERVTLELIEGCNPFATSDACALPYPSSFFEKEDPQSPTGVRGNYPEDLLPNPSGSTHFDISIANLADGASPATPILLHFAADVDPDFLIPIENLEDSLSITSPVALFNLETGKRVMFMSEMDMNRGNEDYYQDRFAMIIRPMEPMEMGDRHVVVLNQGITDDEGQEFESPEAFEVLRDGIYTTNEAIENKRVRFEEIFTFLDDKGYSRENIMLCWDFMVASDDWLLGSAISIRNETLNAIKTEEFSYTITNIKNNPDSNTHMQVEGTFEVPNFLIPDTDDNEDSHTFEYDENHHPVRQAVNASYPFTMLIPKVAVDSAEPLPLLMFGHGIFGSGRQYLSWSSIRRLANENKIIILATDWIGLSSADQDLIIDEILPNINRINIITDRLQQSFVNNLILTELGMGKLGQDEDLQVATNALIDTNQIYYYGVSLGGIQGSSFVSLSNRITRAVFAVPGSVWSNMLPRSNVWIQIKDFFDLFYPDPLIQQIGVAFMQARFDHSDPINLTKLMYETPLDDAPANRSIMIQESMEDCLVPNMTTEMLGRAIGVKQMLPTQSTPYGFTTTDAPSSEPVMVQYYLANQIAGYVPPKENIPAPQDNRTHDRLPTLPDVVSQVKHFLDTGEVSWFCDDVCTCEGVCTF